MLALWVIFSVCGAILSSVLPDKEKSDSIRSSIMDALSQHDVSSVEYLINNGIDLNNQIDLFPFIHAANFNFLDGITYLLDHGSSVDEVEGDGWTPLCFCAYQVFHFVIFYLFLG